MERRNKFIIAFTFLGGMIVGMLIHSFMVPGGGSTQGTIHSSRVEHDDHDENHAEEIVRLDEEELEEFGIELAIAGQGKLQIHTDLTGEIVVDPNRLAHIVPRFPGVVREIHKKIGDRVKKGEVIAVIESNESLSPYKVRSLIDGTVIELHMTKGELIEDQGHSVIVADLSHVWCNLSVYQKDLPYIHVGKPVTITAGHLIPEERGEISYVSPVVDEETRTATARVILPNPDGLWKPGLFVEGRLAIEEVNSDVVVPKTAIETLKGQEVVFVQTEDGFAPRTVVLGRSDETHVEIVGGLEPGQRYVARNGFTLKAELEKGAFGGGHGH